jgi:metallophosphoesterase superfamily enzyme
MEKRETITLDNRAQRRLYVLNHLLTGDLTGEEAGRVLNLSEREVRRLLKRYRVDGAAGLVHGNHDRAPARTGQFVLERGIGGRHWTRTSDLLHVKQVL